MSEIAHTLTIDMPHTGKLKLIREVNHFALHSAQGSVSKHLKHKDVFVHGVPITKTVMEINFALKSDAALFKLSYNP